MTADPGAVGRWAAAHAATVTRPAAGAAPEPADASAPLFPREPVPAVLAAFTEVRTWDGAAGHINRVAWAPDPDGRLLLATGATNGTARIWDAGTGQELHTLTGHTEMIDTVEWGRGRDGRLLLATGSFDGTARIWDPDTGECLHTLTCHGGDPYAPAGVIVAWGTGADGQSVLATGDQSDTVRIWDPNTGRELSTFLDEEPDRASGSNAIYSMVLAAGADGQTRLAACSFHGGMLRISDPVTGQVLYASAANRTSLTHSIAYGHRADGQLVLATADDDEVHIWTENNGGLTEELLPAVDGDTYGVQWAPLTGGRLLLATATVTAVHLWDGHALRRLHTEELDFTDTGPGRLDWTLTPDGQLLLATAFNGGQVRIWEAVLDPPTGSSEGGAQQSPASGRAVPQKPGPARLVLPPEEVTPRFPEAAQFPEVPTSLACVTTPDGRSLIATTSELADVQLWDLESGRHLRTLTGHSGTVFDVAWVQTADGRPLLATASRDATARIWDPDTGQELRTLTGHDGIVEAVGWGTRPDGRPLLATAGFDDTARIWDPDTGQELRVLTGHTDSTYAIAWATLPDGTMLLATGSLDGTARIWDPDTGQELGVLPGPGQQSDPGQQDDEIYTVAWAQAADGRLLATVGTGGTARIWDAGTGAELASLPGTGSKWRSAAWTRDGEGNLLLLLASPEPGSGPVRAWLVEAGSGEPAEPPGPGRAAGPRAAGPRAAEAGRQVLRLGAGGLWLPLGLVADLVALTGPGAAGPGATGPGAGLHDAGLGVLAGEPGIARLAGLAAGPPRWDLDARAAFAALLAAGLDVPAAYVPPGGAGPAVLAAALAAALAAPAGGPGGPGVAGWRAPVAGLRAAAAGITGRAVTLLEILGPAACAADPLLPLRLAHHVPRLPALSPRELRVLAAAGGRRPASPGAAAAGTLAYSPGTVGVARSGPLTRLLPTQLALPAGLRTARLAEDQLLYRQHRAPAPPAPEPVTLILDDTPPTYGPAGTALRLAAHLITTTLWAHGHHPALITLGAPAAPAALHAPADLLALWTAATLEDPGPRLAAARHTAAALGQPAVLLTHHHTARDSRYAPGPLTRLLTTHQPPDPPPPDPASPWHAHLPPAPTPAQLTTAITRLLTPPTSTTR